MLQLLFSNYSSSANGMKLLAGGGICLLFRDVSEFFQLAVVGCLVLMNAFIIVMLVIKLDIGGGFFIGWIHQSRS